MPIIQPDLSEAADLSPIAEGTYKARIVEVKPEKSKKKQENMLEVKVKVLDHTMDPPKEKTRKTYIMIEGAGAGGFDQLLRACHMDDLADQYKNPDLTTKPPFDTDSLLEQAVQVTIVPEIYQKAGPDGNPLGEPELRDRIKGFLKD